MGGRPPPRSRRTAGRPSRPAPRSTSRRLESVPPPPQPERHSASQGLTELLAEIWLWAVAVRAVVGCGERRLEWMHRIECGWSGQRLRVQRAGWGHTLACASYKALVLWYG